MKLTDFTRLIIIKSGAFEVLHDISVTIEDGTMNAIIAKQCDRIIEIFDGRIV